MSVPNAHRYEFQTIEGESIKLSDLKGKAVLVVNTASQCGFTPQYAGLQKLHETYGDKGLVVIGVPSDNFGGQEFEQEAEVKNFTKEKFEATFPLAVISDVKGKNAHPFYQWANKEAGFLGSPKWNFHKYLIGKDGNLKQWFASTTAPDSKKIIAAIEQELNQ
ncbi:MAG: glutathione peroxidase [Rickettsiales bacterium]|nr:glutathione peroxidase [Rickettsiales bacterium]